LVRLSTQTNQPAQQHANQRGLRDECSSGRSQGRWGTKDMQKTDKAWQLVLGDGATSLKQLTWVVLQAQLTKGLFHLQIH